jgi:hypothetical protein
VGTWSFLRSRYFALWLLALAALGLGVYWVVFRARPPAALGPVNPQAVKTEAVDSPADLPPAPKRPEPQDAELSHAQFSIASSDGQTVMDVQARQAEKHGKRYTLKEGTINFRNGDSVQVRLTITDATYEIFPGDTPALDQATGQPLPPPPAAAPGQAGTGAAASPIGGKPPAAAPPATVPSNDAYATVEGSMHGELVGTGQSFDAQRLRWDEKTNVIQAEAVRYYGPRIHVDGETMRIALPSGAVDFTGPVTSTINADLGGK